MCFKVWNYIFHSIFLNVNISVNIIPKYLTFFLHIPMIYMQGTVSQNSN